MCWECLWDSLLVGFSLTRSRKILYGMKLSRNLSGKLRTVISAFPGVQLGVARTFWDILYIEGYIGGGVRYAFYEDSNPNFQQDDPYYSNYYDVSDAEYRGVAPNIGMKVGVAF